MADVAIVGAGIVGTCLAYHLGLQGAAVTLIDAGDREGSATKASFAWVNANSKLPREYFDLNRAGMEEHRHLASALNEPSRFHPTGNTEWATTSEGQRILTERVARLREWGYQAELLPIGELRAIEPNLKPPADVKEFAWFPDEGFVETSPLVSNLRTLCARTGASFLDLTTVTALIDRDGRITGLRTSTGDVVEAGHVVICAGSRSTQLLAMAGLELPMAPAVGMIAVSSPATGGLRGVHHNELMHVRSAAGNRVVMRHTDFDAMVEIGAPPGPEVIKDLHARVSSVLPSLSHCQIEEVWVAIRPVPADGFPVAGPTGVNGLSVLVTHSGVTLGPLLGRLMAEEIVEGRESLQLEPFRPSRLVRSLSTG